MDKLLKEKTITEKYVEKWLEENGFKYELQKQTISKTEWKVRKGDIEDILSVDINLKTKELKAKMKQYAVQFENLKELQGLRKLVKP